MDALMEVLSYWIIYQFMICMFLFQFFNEYLILRLLFMDLVKGGSPSPHTLMTILSTNYSNLILMMCNLASTPTTLKKGIMNIFTIYVLFFY